MFAAPPSLGKGDRSRRELVDIAIDCFSRFGYRGTSIERIARAAGVTKGAIYYHFRGKDELLAATVADRVIAFEQRVQRACEGQPSSEALRRIARVCIDHARSDDHPRFAITLMVETIDTNDKVSAELRDMMRRFRAFLRNLVRQGQADGSFDQSADAEAVAAAYTSAVLGAEIQYYQDPERFAFKKSLATFLDNLIDNLQTKKR